MSTYKQIDITGVDLAKFVKDVYDLSRPQGMGFLHARDGALDDATVAQIIAQTERKPLRLYMDYVHGRACKMGVSEKDGKLLINDRWFDHSEHALNELLRRQGLDKADRTIEINSEA